MKMLTSEIERKAMDGVITEERKKIKGIIEKKMKVERKILKDKNCI